ncbi:BZ3500_MvSof-1268-A1-R1_Chr3-3g06556 [Microbotryum saponariae]|uniref:RNA helicase n=1 Tax=Microbotryum saponariae TaxID=289078 RepID=A0A2X0LYI5_9BASI|nr:BZ3500_MvSof-1268-A1-R1_Chr3-3g06556 [Microbotryum saponariae]SDA04523.1 BZ3501_MvSof-1269-A2-R1_Chr3-2g06243 [Microbotryum saponariae]
MPRHIVFDDAPDDVRVAIASTSKPHSTSTFVKPVLPRKGPAIVKEGQNGSNLMNGGEKKVSLEQGSPSSPPSTEIATATENKATKRPRSGTGSPNKSNGNIVGFHESDEEDLKHQAKRLAANGSGNVAEERSKRKEVAKRLEKGRMELPIWQGKRSILKSLEQNDTVVILGETGSGKTTQVPQFILNSSTPCASPRIAVTQPRRVAATSLASRVSAEIGCKLGGLVGYTVRFDDRSTPATRLKYMTDGALLAEMLGDQDLLRYDVVILDEAHERSLRTDMLLGFLKGIQKRRRERVMRWSKGKKKGKSGVGEEGEEKEPTELKIVVMSATIDAKRFSDFFDGAPVLYVKGRQHAVTIMYSEEPQVDYLDAALKVVFQLHMRSESQLRGDILVFLPGQDDIDALGVSIKSYAKDLVVSHPEHDAVSSSFILVCPLYAKLSPTEQAKAFIPTPPHTRKVILATNVAETSITIPGIRFVVDTGLAKEKQYHASVGIDSLVSEPISQSSALQRTGRAGREGPGVCFRLYTEEFFHTLPRTTKPEIQRVSLTFALLHLLAAGQGDVWSFDFMDRPERDSITFALLTLHGLGALDKKGQITPLGKRMALLPLDPIYAKVLLTSFEESCPRRIIDLVALLGSKDQLFISTFSTREEANKARIKFRHRSGDHWTLLNVLQAYEGIQGTEQRKEWCRANFVNHRAMVQVLDARKQVRDRCEGLGLEWDVEGEGEGKGGEEEEEERVLASLIAGLFANSALLQPDGSYRHTISRQPIMIHPGSTLHHKKVPAIVYDELVLTTKTYARGVSAILPMWLRTKAPTVFNAKEGK